MLILGVILIILGALLGIHILFVLGVILAIIGLVLLVLGADRTGGRRYY